MKDVLITLGDSFTYGEGLSYEYMKQNYPNTFQELFKLPQNILKGKIRRMSDMIHDFDEYRIKNNYSYFLKEKLDSQLITISQCGGRNIERLMDLDFIIENLVSLKISFPKYVVFQLTHIGRDIEDILLKNDRTEKYIQEVFGNDYIRKVVNATVDGRTAWDLDTYFEEATEFFLKELGKRFNWIEKNFGAKCIFFFGLGDTFTIKKMYPKLLVSPYFMEIVDEKNTYHTWLSMNEKIKLNLRCEIGVPDDHPSSNSHRIIADKIYQRLKHDI